ncbi:MAG TPA: stage II sporulation protein M, partial [Longimicrobiaceae bacterium]|nr:stage II sporulation protein M [Longimicrobiaceae bacterium]
VRRQRADWDAYGALLERARKRGLDALPEREVSRFAALYREVAADLARARTYGGSPELVYTLERWVGAGHNLLYRPPRRSWRRVRAWLAGGFPALVRLRWRPIALAAAFFYLPALLAFAAVRADPPRAREIVPAEMMVRAEEAQRKEAAGEGYVEVPEIFMPAMGAGIIANNVQVTFVAFAGGILAGLGTVASLVFNGVFLGAVAGLFANHGASLHLWTFVLPHGAIELTAICIAGGAGFWLASAILIPGRRTRREALVRRGREAVSLLGGTVVLLVVAGTIEGFVSPAPIPRPLKLSLAALFALLLVAYLALAGRGRDALPDGEEAAP